MLLFTSWQIYLRNGLPKDLWESKGNLSTGKKLSPSTFTIQSEVLQTYEFCGLHAGMLIAKEISLVLNIH